MTGGGSGRVKRKGDDDQAEENKGGEREAMRARRRHGRATVPSLFPSLALSPAIVLACYNTPHKKRE